MSTILKAEQKNKGRIEAPVTHLTPAWKNIFLIVLSSFVVLLMVVLCYLFSFKQGSPMLKKPQVLVLKTLKTVTLIHFKTKPLPPLVNVDNKLNAPIEITKTVKNRPKIKDDELPHKLESRFKAALLVDNKKADNASSTLDEVSVDSTDLSDMPSDFQHLVPAIYYATHMYSSVVTERFIKINGKRLTEGMFDNTGKIQLLEIQPQLSIFRVENQRFSLQSLVDWPGI
ncbi:general secretion pathway protein GspB [Psychromonas sp. CD1]|uniref:general secretion pathway protein GspB n=1 Tax=Psychromonas sp. CD1 TaxID=1979839 RepID=UPI000B9A7541|nr:general secretion pathway protein GspB [Psychromonas sp. CD1]